MTYRELYQRWFIEFRRRRMRQFYALLQPGEDTRLLDIGGNPNTWQRESTSELRFPVTMVNLHLPSEKLDEHLTALIADATLLPFADGSFDIVFSNSVIEHMTTWEEQRRFAAEARRMAPKLWIQTPARSFPVEPHFLAPFFQFLPRPLQLRLARHFTVWGLMTKPSAEQVEAMLADIRLLSFHEFKELFPDCMILKERVLGITKSYVAVRI